MRFLGKLLCSAGLAALPAFSATITGAVKGPGRKALHGGIRDRRKCPEQDDR